MTNPISRCGWCSSVAAMIPLNHPPVITREDGGLAYGWAVFQCPGCGALSLADGFYAPGNYEYSEGLYSVDAFSPTGWYPKEPLIKPYPDSVPEQVASMAAEAHGCGSVKHLRAASIMARATIEASAKEVGVTTGNLKDKITKLGSLGLIYPWVVEAAQEIREAGNESAHGDIVVHAADEAEVSSVLNLMDRVIDGLFVAPSEPAAQQLRREQRAAANAAAGPKA